MKKYKNWLIVLTFLFMLVTLPALLFAQPPGDPGGDVDAPIDGGLSLLLLAGIGYGVKKIRGRKKDNNTINF